MSAEHCTIITGGGRGIGQAIALRMAEETAVLLVGRTEADLASTCSQIKHRMGKAAYCMADVGNPASAAAVLKVAHDLGWTVKNLVCNAGIGKSGPLANFDPNEWRNIFDVNVHGTFSFAQACLPEITHTGGSISIISSTCALRGYKNDSAYCASKFALNGLAQSLAAECEKFGVAVVPICPGYVRGEMTNRSIASRMKHKGCTKEEAIAYLAEQNEQGRLLHPQEVAEAVAFVASGAAMPFSGLPMMLDRQTDARILKLVNWIRHAAAPAKKLVVPVSGGSDSALVLKLCAMAYPEKTMGVHIYTGRELRGIEYLRNVAPIVYLDTPEDIEPEIGRWAEFQDVARRNHGWLVGSRNLTEQVLGFYSLASRVATFLPIASVWKGEVMELCEAIGIPDVIIESSRRADPDCGRPKELAEIPLEIIDLFAKNLEGWNLPDEAITAEQERYLAAMHEHHKFKHDLPTLGPRVP